MEILLICRQINCPLDNSRCWMNALICATCQWTCSGCLLRHGQRVLQNIHLWTASKLAHVGVPPAELCRGRVRVLGLSLATVHMVGAISPLALSWGFPCCLFSVLRKATGQRLRRTPSGGDLHLVPSSANHEDSCFRERKKKTRY